MASQGAASLVESSPGSESLRGWPLPPALTAEVHNLIARLDANQRMWLSGYLAGTAQAFEQPAAVAPPAPQRTITILYGSQSGNAESLAHKFADTLQRHSLSCSVLDMADCGKAELMAATTVLVVVSTQGEGDPPDRARSLWELLNSRKAPRLSHLRYAVLGLGDSSYEHFCEMGRQFDARLEALGAQRMHPRADCDVDFETAADAWIGSVAGKLAEDSGTRVSVAEPARDTAAVAVAYTRKNPFHAELLLNQRITASASTKDVRHIELSLTGSELHYEPGDAIGIVPRNDPQAVDELLSALPFSAEASVTVGNSTISLRESLLQHYEIGPISRSLLERYSSAMGEPSLKELLADGSSESLPERMRGWHLVDLVQEFPPGRGVDAQAFTQCLRPLAPRLYSIASSLRASPEEAHLTVSVVEYEVRGRKRRGVVSGMLARIDSGETLPIYVHRNAGFRLPAPDVPIIMIGPGTGVAPFRAFVAERAALGAPGRNWLFFGDRSFETDFLYQAEWLAWRKQGVLTRIEVAFSRDQPEKVYVQHRIRDCGAELWRWLEEGAHVYVCGDAQQMAPDVHRALTEVAERHGGLSEERAAEYFSELVRQRRYQRDVY
jgi:sulfite reductase (NADPH) flavoprotein alpha-component